MKKVKKIMALFLSLAMLVSIFSGTGMQMQAASSSTVVYFNNKTSNWSNVYAYVWGSGLTTKAIKGEKVTSDIYKIEIPGSYSNILFKNTSGTSSWDKKTANTAIPTDGKNCFKPSSSSNKSSGTWSKYTEVVEPTETAALKDASVTFYYNNSKTQWSEVHAYIWGGDTTTTVKGTPIATNVYSFTISSNYQNVLFKNTSGTSSWDKQTADTGAPQVGKIFTPSSASNKTGGTWNDYTVATATPTVAPATATPTVAPVNNISISYDNSKTNWSSVYVYAWVEGDSSVTPVIVKSIALVNNVYYFRVADTYKNILFKNTDGTNSWDQQTSDTTLPNDYGYTFVTYSGANKTGGYWTKTPVTTAPVTTAPVTTAPVTTVPATATPTVAPVNNISISYDNSKTNWSSVYVYAWVEGDSSVTPVIVKSIALVNNVYYFRVADTYKNILFKNTDGTNSWDQQTSDTTLPNDYGYTFVTYSGANKTGGYWTKTPVTTAPVTTAPATPTVKPTDTPAPNTVTFYFDNSKTNWSSVYVYAWGGETTSAIKGTSLGSNVYTFTISSNYQKVLFKNTAGTSSWDKQTADTGAPQAGKIFTPSSSSNKTGGSWNAYTTPTQSPTPAPVTNTTVSYDNSKTNWSNVYAYVWTEGNSSVTPMVLASTSVSGNTYTFQVAGTYKNILFKNTSGTTSWDKQTADANIPTSSGYIFLTYSGNNKTAGYWEKIATPTPIVVTPTPTPIVVTPTPIPTAKVVRRALCIADAAETDGSTAESRGRHWRDAQAMAKTFQNFTFDGQPMDTVGYYSDLTVAQVTEKIRTTFAQTTDDDVSYLYLNCHGGSTGYIAIGSINGTGYTGAQLRSVLDQYVKGEVVIILHCCFSGNAIEEDIQDVDIANQFLASFMGVGTNSGELAAERFHVLCSSSKTEYTWSYSYGIATRHETAGLGWDEINERVIDLKADANGDRKVTMAELYNYTYPLVLDEISIQHVVVYPENDNFVIGGRY